MIAIVILLALVAIGYCWRTRDFDRDYLAMMIAAAVFAALYRAWALWREIELLSHGRAAATRTVSVRKVLWLPHRRLSWRVTCKLSTHDDEPRILTVKSQTSIAENTEVIIVYDADQPAHAIFYPVPYLKVRGAA